MLVFLRVFFGICQGMVFADFGAKIVDFVRIGKNDMFMLQL